MWWPHFRILGGNQNDVLCLSAPGRHPIPCHPGWTINKMWGVPGAERLEGLRRCQFAWMWVPCYFALSHNSSSSLFPSILFILFFPSTFNLIIEQFSYLFTLLLHLFIYLSFFPLSDPLELFSPYQDTLWSAIFGDWLESLFLSGNTGPHLCYTRTSLWNLFFVFLSGVCTTFHTSGYDTQAIVQNNDSTEYGLFQINNKIWCKDDQNPHSSNICNISCDSE